MQRQLDRQLDEAEVADERHEWDLVRYRVRSVLALDTENHDALAYLNVAEHALSVSSPLQSGEACLKQLLEAIAQAPPPGHGPPTAGPQWHSPMQPASVERIPGHYKLERSKHCGTHNRLTSTCLRTE